MIDKAAARWMTCGMSAKPDPATLPCSPLDETAGLKYFPRMLGKIRLHAASKLWEDLHANLGKGSVMRLARIKPLPSERSPAK